MGPVKRCKLGLEFFDVPAGGKGVERRGQCARPEQGDARGLAALDRHLACRRRVDAVELVVDAERTGLLAVALGPLLPASDWRGPGNVTRSVFRRPDEKVHDGCRPQDAQQARSTRLRFFLPSPSSSSRSSVILPAAAESEALRPPGGDGRLAAVPTSFEKLVRLVLLDDLRVSAEVAAVAVGWVGDRWP